MMTKKGSPSPSSANKNKISCVINMPENVKVSKSSSSKVFDLD